MGKNRDDCQRDNWSNGDHNCAGQRLLDATQMQIHGGSHGSRTQMATRRRMLRENQRSMDAVAGGAHREITRLTNETKSRQDLGTVAEVRAKT